VPGVSRHVIATVAGKAGSYKGPARSGPWAIIGR
jgi:hypothetical protein